jgi:hypothetical protein
VEWPDDPSPDGDGTDSPIGGTAQVFHFHLIFGDLQRRIQSVAEAPHSKKSRAVRAALVNRADFPSISTAKLLTALPISDIYQPAQVANRRFRASRSSRKIPRPGTE